METINMDEKAKQELIDAIGKKVDDGLISTNEAVTALKEKNIELQAKVDVLASKNVISLPGVDEEKEKFSFGKAIYGISTNKWGECGFEKSVLDATREKALSVGTDTGAGFLVPEEFMTELIPLLRANTVLDKMGVTSLSPTSSPFKIPRQTGGATGFWLGENIPLTASQQTVDQITMQPNMVGALVKASNRVVDLSNPSVEAMIRRDIAQVIARQIDIKALSGSGSSNQPLGIINQPGISTISASTVPSYDMLLDLEGLLEDANALDGNLGYVSAPKTWRILRKQKVENFTAQAPEGTPLFAPIVSMAKLRENTGYNIQATTQLPIVADSVATIFGNWQELIWATWGSMVLEASTVAGDASGGAFTSNQLWIKATMETDIALRHPESFAVATDTDVS